jgi:hypothetical protein
MQRDALSARLDLVDIGYVIDNLLSSRSTDGRRNAVNNAETENQYNIR